MVFKQLHQHVKSAVFKTNIVITPLFKEKMSELIHYLKKRWFYQTGEK